MSMCLSEMSRQVQARMWNAKPKSSAHSLSARFLGIVWASFWAVLSRTYAECAMGTTPRAQDATEPRILDVPRNAVGMERAPRVFVHARPDGMV